MIGSSKDETEQKDAILVIYYYAGGTRSLLILVINLEVYFSSKFPTLVCLFIDCLYDLLIHYELIVDSSSYFNDFI